MDPTQFDPTLIGRPAVQIAVIVAVTNYVKRAYLSEAAAARYGPLLAIGVGLLVGLLASGVTGDPLARALALGAGYGLAASLLYPYLPARFRGRPHPPPPDAQN